MLNVSTRIDVSHGTIHQFVQKIGEKVRKYNENIPTKSTKKKKVDEIFIEGDGVYIGSRDKDYRRLIMNRIVIHEGSYIGENTKRKKLKNPVCFESFEASENVFNQVKIFLNQHYNLKNTVVYSNSDGGSGFEESVFRDAVGVAKEHLHRRDLYHVYQKMMHMLHFDREFMFKVIDSVKKHDLNLTISLLDTTESRLTHNSDDDESYLENIDKLRNYLRRNWQYIVPFEENKDKSLGICESGHRLYTYRMKKQGNHGVKKEQRICLQLSQLLRMGILKKLVLGTLITKVIQNYSGRK